MAAKPSKTHSVTGVSPLDIDSPDLSNDQDALHAGADARAPALRTHPRAKRAAQAVATGVPSAGGYVVPVGAANELMGNLWGPGADFIFAAKSEGTGPMATLTLGVFVSTWVTNPRKGRLSRRAGKGTFALSMSIIRETSFLNHNRSFSQLQGRVSYLFNDFNSIWHT